MRPPTWMARREHRGSPRARQPWGGRGMSPLRALVGSAAAAAAPLPAPLPHASSDSDALASLDAKQAYFTGVELNNRRHSSQSLPYFRRALALRPDLWQVHCDYAAALINAAVEARSSRGAAQ